MGSRQKFGDLRNKLRPTTAKLNKQVVSKKKEKELMEQMMFQESSSMSTPKITDETTEETYVSQGPSESICSSETVSDTESIIGHTETQAPATYQSRYETSEKTEHTEPVSRSFTKSKSTVKEDKEEYSVPVRTSRRKQEEDLIPNNNLLKLVKMSGLNTATKELIDALKLLINEVSIYLLDRMGHNIAITSEIVRKQIIYFFKDDQADVDQEMILHPQGFEKMIRPLLEERKCSIKRDVLYYFQLFIECFLIRILQSSDMVAEANNRSRVSGRDVLVAFSILTL